MTGITVDCDLNHKLASEQRADMAGRGCAKALGKGGDSCSLGRDFHLCLTPLMAGHKASFTRGGKEKL